MRFRISSLITCALVAAAVLVGNPTPAAAAPGIPAGETVQRVITYEVRTRGAVQADLGTFIRVASQTMNDKRGWSLGGSILFRIVPSGGDFTLWLAAPSQVPTFSSVCSAQWSCRVGRNVIINDERWRTGTSTWPDVREYRQYVVNHELGHWLGRGHTSCPRAGSPAPVMQQQSISLQGCVSNTWPLVSEKRPVAARFGVPMRSVRPDLYAVDMRGTTVSVVDGNAGGYSGYTTVQGRFSTALPRIVPVRWDFAALDYNRDGVDDVVGIKVWGASGRVEVQVLDGASGYRRWAVQARTALPRVSGTVWWFGLADWNGDGFYDLVGVNRQGPGNRTTVDVLDGRRGFGTFLLRNAPTPMPHQSPAVTDFDLGDHDRDGVPDLYVVHRRGGSGTTEVHVMDGTTDFRLWNGHGRTPLGWTDTSWDFAVDDWDGDGWDEVYALRRDGVSGHTGVHVLRDRTYSAWEAHAETPLPRTDGQSAWQFALD